MRAADTAILHLVKSRRGVDDDLPLRQECETKQLSFPSVAITITAVMDEEKK